jgi:hypothetical protein
MKLVQTKAIFTPVTIELETTSEVSLVLLALRHYRSAVQDNTILIRLDQFLAGVLVQDKG